MLAADFSLFSKDRQNILQNWLLMGFIAKLQDVGSLEKEACSGKIKIMLGILELSGINTYPNQGNAKEASFFNIY